MLLEARQLLLAFMAGKPEEALALWVDSYFDHWELHARMALGAIDAFYCRTPNAFDEPER